MTLLVHTQPFTFLVLFMVFFLACGWSLLTAAWDKLATAPIRLHLAGSAIIALGVFWSLVSIKVNDVLSIHLSLITSVVLVFGFRFSLVIGALALAILHLLSHAPWENYGLHFIVSVLTPALVTIGFLQVIKRIPLKILFFYTLGAGFIGGMLSMVAVGVASYVLLALFDSTMYWPIKDHFYLFLLLAFPAGFCNGMIISSLAVLRPDLVKTFDEKFYIDDN